MIIIIASIAAAFYLYLAQDAHSSSFNIVVSSLIFLLFSFGIHGLIAHALHPEFKGNIIFYPIWMWALWAVLFLLFVFFVIPLYCPDFNVFS